MTDPRIAARREDAHPEVNVFNGSEVYFVHSAKPYMDAQDARIEVLKGSWAKTSEELNAQTVRALEAEQRIAELEQEIREAHELLEDVSSAYRGPIWWGKLGEWILRNAEKEQGK